MADTIVTLQFMRSFVTQLHYIQGILRKTLFTICFIHTPYSLPVHFLPSPEYPALQAHAYISTHCIDATVVRVSRTFIDIWIWTCSYSWLSLANVSYGNMKYCKFSQFRTFTGSSISCVTSSACTSAGAYSVLTGSVDVTGRRACCALV